MISLHDIAPRLALARAQLLAERRAASTRQLQIAHERLRLQWLVAHRELQLVRAGATGNGKYIRHRANKLERAQADLAALEIRARQAP